MLALLTQRLAYRFGTSSVVRGVAHARAATTPIVLPSLTRRTFLSGTPSLSFAPAAAAAAAKKTSAAKKSTAGAAKKTSAKTGTKKAAATKAKAKPKAKPKSKLAAKKKKPLVKKPKKVKPVKPTRPKITKADMPPRAPGNAYVKFYAKYLAGLSSKPKSVAEISSLMKDASALWNNLSDVEKQPYRDEAVAARAAYAIQKQSYFDSVPGTVLSEINRRRTLKGKQRIRNPVKEEGRKPLTSFFRYLADFRATPEGQAIFASKEGGKTDPHGLVMTGGQNWRGMSDAQKAPYSEAAKKDFAAWKARRAVHL